jgi:hypothetical protein
MKKASEEKYRTSMNEYLRIGRGSGLNTGQSFMNKYTNCFIDLVENYESFTSKNIMALLVEITLYLYKNL